MKWKFKNLLIKSIRAILWTAIIIMGALIIVKLAKNRYPSVTKEISSKDIHIPIMTDNHPVSIGNFINLPSVFPAFSSNNKSDDKMPLLVLGKSNTLVFRDVVTQESMGHLEDQLNSMSHKLSKSTPIFLVMDTPGGEVEAGSQFIDMANALPQEIITITLFSASMGFHIVENLGHRLITPSGTLMSHRVAISGLEGRIPGEAVVRMNHIIAETNRMDKVIAKRVGMKLEDYQSLIHDEYWISGQDAVNDHMADKVVLITCADDLNDSYVQSMQTLFGTIKVEWSSCPTINFPLRTNAVAILNNIQDKNDKKAFADFINTYLNNKKEFIHKFIVNENYKRFINE